MSLFPERLSAAVLIYRSAFLLTLPHLLYKHWQRPNRCVKFLHCRPQAVFVVEAMPPTGSFMYYVYLTSACFKK